MIALLLAVAPARAADATLDGWRDFRFGMSVDLARQVPGMAWGALQTPPGSISILPSSGEVSDFARASGCGFLVKWVGARVCMN